MILHVAFQQMFHVTCRLHVFLIRVVLHIPAEDCATLSFLPTPQHEIPAPALTASAPTRSVDHPSCLQQHCGFPSLPTFRQLRGTGSG